MNSCLYECSVMHHRFAPKVHHFQHDIFMFYLDLDELDAIARKNFLFGHNRKSIYNFRDADHEPAGPTPLKERVLKFLHQNEMDLGPSPRVMLLTLPRVCGYIFNPVSIYYCFDTEGAPVCAIAEVGNTFREMKLYLLPRDKLSARPVFQGVVPKHFYVSPFSRLDLNFDFRLGLPGDKLAVRIDDCDGPDTVLKSTLDGCPATLNNRNLFWFSCKYPLVTLKVIFLIHWHAFALWRKKVPFYRKAENASQQREVLRPFPTADSMPK